MNDKGFRTNKGFRTKVSGWVRAQSEDKQRFPETKVPEQRKVHRKDPGSKGSRKQRLPQTKLIVNSLIDIQSNHYIF